MEVFKTLTLKTMPVPINNIDTQFNRTTRIFHWLGALMILAMLGIGFVMTHYAQDFSRREWLTKIHVGLGLATLALTALRLVWVFVGSRPMPLKMPRWRELAYNWNHRLFYVVVIGMLATGVIMLVINDVPFNPLVWTSPNDAGILMKLPNRPKQLHELMSKLFVALLVMHLAGVLHHQWTAGDTLGRMGINVPFGKKKVKEIRLSVCQSVSTAV